MSAEVQNYKDIECPVKQKKLIVNLFADNTIIYLLERDKHKDLVEILDKWCNASAAKLNTEKTKIVPMGALP